jgi:hypothetical protein
LKKFTEQREVSIEEASYWIDAVHENHKDWYPIAYLLTHGYLEWSIRSGGANWDTTQCHLVAKEIFLLFIGNEYNKYGYEVGYEDPPEKSRENLYFYPSPKAFQYFKEQKQKRNDVRNTLYIGILIACITSFLTALFTYKIDSILICIKKLWE